MMSDRPEIQKQIDIVRASMHYYRKKGISELDKVAYEELKEELERLKAISKQESYNKKVLKFIEEHPNTASKFTKDENGNFCQ